MAAKPRGAPPFAWTPEIEAEIFERMMAGKSLRQICASKGMPAASTFLLRVSQNAALAEQYARAREIQGDDSFDRVGDVVEDVLAGKIDPASARVAIDAIKWRAGKLRPKVYGDKLELGGSGEGGAIVTQTIIRTIVDPKPDGGA